MTECVITSRQISRTDGASHDRCESCRHEIRDGLNEPIDLAAESDGCQRLGTEPTDHDEVSESDEGLRAEPDDRRPCERPDAE